MNPYTPIFGVAPSAVLGRDFTVERFSKGLISGMDVPRRALLVPRPRGIGKTIAVNKLVNAAARQRWVVPQAQPHSFVRPSVDTVITHARSMVGQGAIEARRISRMSIAGLRAIYAEIVVDVQSAPSTITALNSLSITLGKNSGVTLTLDEIQSANPNALGELSEVTQSLRRDNRHRTFAAAVLPRGTASLLNPRHLIPPPRPGASSSFRWPSPRQLRISAQLKMQATSLTKRARSATPSKTR